MMMMEKTWGEAVSQIGWFLFMCGMLRQALPDFLIYYFQKFKDRLVSHFFPYVEITFPEYSSGRFKRSEAYTTIETYLGSKSTDHAHRLKGDIAKKRRSVSLTMDDMEEIVDFFQGASVTWFLSKSVSNSKSISWYPADNEKRHYVLTFHNKNRDLITNNYLDFVMQEGKKIASLNRQRRLYTNNPSDNWMDYKKYVWSHVAFEHPATFEILAIDPKLKEDIINDLNTFVNGKEYYAKIGKPWKRGYLLYGPPGTGKSTLIAAMANFLNYDIYDLELTAVKDNTELRKLSIDISAKSIIVIEDIDCTLELTGERKKKSTNKNECGTSDSAIKKIKDREENGDNEDSKVTLSGLLNFIDGLWSASVGEKIIVFTTNHVERLDPALIRRGRMDKHIELSYCGFEAFKILAKNYLDVDDDSSHYLFETIKNLLEETKITPADVAENLMPKTSTKDVDCCLQNLIQALKTIKEDAIMKTKKTDTKKTKRLLVRRSKGNGDE